MRFTKEGSNLSCCILPYDGRTVKRWLVKAGLGGRIATRLGGRIAARLGGRIAARLGGRIAARLGGRIAARLGGRIAARKPLLWPQNKERRLQWAT